MFGLVCGLLCIHEGWESVMVPSRPSASPYQNLGRGITGVFDPLELTWFNCVVLICDHNMCKAQMMGQLQFSWLIPITFSKSVQQIAIFFFSKNYNRLNAHMRFFIGKFNCSQWHIYHQINVYCSLYCGERFCKIDQLQTNIIRGKKARLQVQSERSHHIGHVRRSHYIIKTIWGW